MGLLSDSGIIKPSGNVNNSGQASQLLVFLLPMLQTPDTISSLLIPWERVCSSHCNTQLMAVSPSPVHCVPSNIFIFSNRSRAHISCSGFCSPSTAEHIRTVLEMLPTGKLWATQRFCLPPVGKGDHPPGLYGQHAFSKCPNGGLCCSLRNKTCSSNSISSGQLAADRAQPASSQFCIFTHEGFGSRQDPTAL